MNNLLRWCFLVLLTISFVACETEDDEVTPSSNNQSTNNNNGNNGGNSGGGNTSGAFISGDVDGDSYNIEVTTYNEFSGFIQAIGIDTSGNLPRLLSIAVRKTLTVGAYKMDNGTLNAITLVQTEDTTRNGGQFQSGSCKDYNGQAAYESSIEFTKIDTNSGEIEGTFNAMAYQGANCIMTDSVLITNGQFKFDYK
ncbi:MAG: hypothetical protein RIC95_09425 [Vicingaceae bacterium]